jgi:hypothetical protein
MSARKIPLLIEGCRIWFRFLCPKSWSQLDRTNSLDVRHCSTCNKDVYYCDSLEALAEHRQAGHCVCVETGLEEPDFILVLGEPGED